MKKSSEKGGTWGWPLTSTFWLWQTHTTHHTYKHTHTTHIIIHTYIHTHHTHAHHVYTYVYIHVCHMYTHHKHTHTHIHHTCTHTLDDATTGISDVHCAREGPRLPFDATCQAGEGFLVKHTMLTHGFAFFVLFPSVVLLRVNRHQSAVRRCQLKQRRAYKGRW